MAASAFIAPIVGGILSLLGGGLGGLAAKKQGGSFWYGKPERMEKEQLFSSGQQNLQNNILDYLSGNSGMQGPLGFGPIRSAALSSWNQDVLPMLQEKFGGNAVSSSGLNQAIAGSLSNLQQQLAGQESQYARSLLGPAFQTSFQNIFRPGVPGALNSLSSGLGGAGKQLLMGGLGNLFSQGQESSPSMPQNDTFMQIKNILANASPQEQQQIMQIFRQMGGV